MFRGGIRVISVVILCVASISAQFTPQNGRMNGLAGTFIIDDMGDIMRYAVFMEQYKDDAQATFAGPVVGIKAIGDVLNLGVIANRGLLLDPSFYQQGSAALTGSFAAQFPQALSTQHIPHFLVGLNLPVISLGFDLFYEYASAAFHNEPPTGPSADGKVRIHNPGGIASVLSGTEEIPVAAKFGLGVPRIGGKYDNGTNETTVKSEKGIMIEAGGEVGIPLGVFDIRSTLGLDLIFETYAFSVNEADPVSDYFNNRLAFYGGVEGELFTNAKWGAMYNLVVRNNHVANPADTTNNRSIIQTYSAGIENTWATVWIFDEFFARGGMALMMTTPVDYTRNATSKIRQRKQTTYAVIGPTIGIGLKKGVFQLDITLNPAEWAGVVTGPDVGTVTATLMF